MISLARSFAALCLALLLAACSSAPPRPDLERLYESHNQRGEQPPLILIHGLMGSTLVERGSGKEFWPGSIGALAFSEYRELARMKAVEDAGGGLVPGDLFYGVGRTDFYSGLIDALEKVGRFRRAMAGDPVADGDQRRYYVLLYDWRKENLEAVRQLHALIEQIRADYGQPDLAVDILAHSNGGLIANYYLRYGPNDVLDQSEPTHWDEGAQRIRRMVLLGTPSLGAVTSLDRLQSGFKIAWRTVPVEVLATFATPFEALPHPDLPVVFSTAGEPIAFDFYDVETWRSRGWSVFSPELINRVMDSAPDPATGAREVAGLQSLFTQHLARAERFQRAVGAPVSGSGVQMAVFGGDCILTPAFAVLDRDGDGERLVIDPKQVRSRVPGVDYERLLLRPGDSLVTRESQQGLGLENVPGRRGDIFPGVQSFFLCETHDQLSVNPYFQNNLLNFLLAP
jgi:pimeloyl-ACP methyl ester carboxylesterase